MELQSVVCGVGEGELPGSYIGPVAKSVASFMHFQMKVPYRKMRILFHELFHLSFTPSAAPGFDGQIRRRGAPIYEQMRQRLPAEPVAHLDETGWRKEGVSLLRAVTSAATRAQVEWFSEELLLSGLA